MAPTVPELIEEFLEEDVGENEFLGFWGLDGKPTELAKGSNLRIDLQCVSLP